jgi:glycosyltransferase involved in cell wall biosynthesis/SAM-dependent methyltransferase
MNNPLHILQISRDASLLETSDRNEGLARQRYYLEMLNSLAPGSHMTILVSSASKANLIDLSLPQLSIVGVRGSRPMRCLKVIGKICAIHRARPVDVATFQTVFDEGSLGALLCAFLGIRSVGQLHFDPFGKAAQLTEFGDTLLGSLRFRFGLLCLRLFHSLRTVGTRTSTYLLEHGLHWKVSTIPVGTFSTAFVPNSEETEQPAYVLFVGRLVRQKRIDRFLRVAHLIKQKCPAMKFLVAGDGPEREAAERLAQELGIADSVTFLGHVGNEKLPLLYQQATLYLMTSDFEGFGRTLVEAYLCSTPAVAPRLAGVEDIIIDGETGFLVEAANEESYCQKALLLIGDRQTRNKFAVAGNRFVKETFKAPHLAESWLKLLINAARQAPDCLLMPKRHSFRRWRSISFAPFSLLRALQYEAISGLSLQGKILDVGGGKKNSYYHLLKLNGSIDSVNIDPTIRPTLITDLNIALPLSDNSYDAIISFNTLEHIRDDEVALQECLRVLKPGGQLFITVPFLYHVHGSPCDYSRKTHFWWVEKLESLGIPRTQIKVEPLVWDKFSTGISIALPPFLEKILRPATLTFSALRSFIFERGLNLSVNRRALSYCNTAVGYFISITK